MTLGRYPRTRLRRTRRHAWSRALVAEARLSPADLIWPVFVQDGKGKLEGNLTLHGVTKPVVLDLELNGETDKGVGFSAKGKIDRREFGIVWNKALDKGGVAVGNDVEITLDIEALKK